MDTIDPTFSSKLCAVEIYYILLITYSFTIGIFTHPAKKLEDFGNDDVRHCHQYFWPFCCFLHNLVYVPDINHY